MTTPAPGADELARRLLGPAAPEVSCAQCFEALDTYVELELADADAERAVPGMASHLKGCSACREEHDTLRALIAGES